MDGLLDTFLLLAIVSVLSAILRSALPGLRDRMSGLLTHLTLRHYLPASHYTIMHNVSFHTGKRRFRIAHIVVSPYGIFVIETRRMAGKISGNREDARWSRNWLGSEKKFPNPMQRNEVSIKMLSRLLHLDPSMFHSLVIIAGSAQFRTAMPLNVTKQGGLLPFIQIRTRPLMDFEDAEHVAARIVSGAIIPGKGSPSGRQSAGAAGYDSATVILRKAAPALLVVALLLVGGGLVNSLTRDLRLSAYPEQVAEEDKSPFVEHAAPPRITLPSTAATMVEAGKLSGGHQQSPDHSRGDAPNKRQAGERLAWTSALMCTLSADARRCSCFEPGGEKAEVGFEDCRVFAENLKEMVNR